MACVPSTHSADMGTFSGVGCWTPDTWVGKDDKRLEHKAKMGCMDMTLQKVQGFEKQGRRKQVWGGEDGLCDQ